MRFQESRSAVMSAKRDGETVSQESRKLVSIVLPILHLCKNSVDSPGACDEFCTCESVLWSGERHGTSVVFRKRKGKAEGAAISFT